MAKKNIKKNMDSENQRPSTKEEIEAAVAACYGGNKKCQNQYGGSFGKLPGIPMVDGTPDEIERKFDEIDASEVEDGYVNIQQSHDEGCGDAKDSPKEEDPSMAKLRDFANDCVALNIDASKCAQVSKEHPDHTIEDYVREINKKIFSEAKSGGFSAEIGFRVIPSDPVNVRHIIDWYRVRGFEILDEDVCSPTMGEDTGTIKYSFTISWAMAKVS